MSSSARRTSSGFAGPLLVWFLAAFGCEGSRLPPPSGPDGRLYREAFEALGGKAPADARGCVECHLGMFDLSFAESELRRKGERREDVIRALKAHPRLDMLAGPSSPHAGIDCRTCHVTTDRGDDPGLDPRRLAEWRRFHMVYHPLLKDVALRIPRSTEAVCFRCHRGEDPLVGADYLRRGRLLYQEAHCHACHETPGMRVRAEGLEPGETRVRLPGPPLTSIADKVDKAWTNGWLHYPTDFKPSARMPPFFPRGEIGFPPQLIDRVPKNQETLYELVLTACVTEYIFARSRPERLEEIPERLLATVDWEVEDQRERGRRLVIDLGCLGCHRIEEDYEIDYRNAERSFREEEFATNLFGSGDKFDSALGRRWLFNWIKDPRRLSPDTPMPSFGLSDQEAADVVQFLVSLKIDNGFRQARGLHQWKPRRAPLEIVGEGVRADPEAVEALDALVKHSGGPVDAPLREKILWQGRRVVEVFGCYACHEMGGEWAGRPLIEGPFHKDLLPGKGVMQRMPLIGTSVEETRAISTYLWAHYEALDPPPVERARNPRLQAYARGERVLEKFNCRGCHVLDEDRIFVRFEGRIVSAAAALGDRSEGEGGPQRLVRWLAEGRTLQASRLREVFGDYLPEASMDRVTFARGGVYAWRRLAVAGDEDKAELGYRMPPSLRTAGRKFRPEWLAAFLRKPHRLRPGRTPVMPAFPFEEGEIEALVEYFRERDGAVPEDGRGRLGREEVEARFERFREIDAMMRRACAQCHAVDGKGAERSVDLALAHGRLQAPWLRAFLADPGSVYPRTAMPEWPKDFPLDDCVDLLVNYDRFREAKVTRGEPAEALEALETVDEGRAGLIELALRRSMADPTIPTVAVRALELVEVGMRGALPPAIGHLRHWSPDVRRAALNALWAVGAHDHGGEIAAVLSDEDATVRVRALETLAGLDLRGQAEAVARALEDAHPFVRRAALEALERLGAVDRAPAIARRLQDEDTAVRVRAAEALGNLGAEGGVQALAGALGDQAAPVRYAALLALARVRAGAAEAEPLLEDPDESVRAAACVCLLRSGVSRGRQALGDMLESGSRNRATRRALALGRNLLLPAEVQQRRVEAGRRTAFEWIRAIGAGTEEEMGRLEAVVPFGGGSLADLAWALTEVAGLVIVERDGELRVEVAE